MNKRFLNALRINTKDLMGSPSVRLTLIVTFIISLVFSYLPFVCKHIFHTNKGYMFQGGFFEAMGICAVFMMFVALMITRIGAQVGFEKGSKETELILTAISRKELYFSHIFSSFIMFFFSLLVMFSPLISTVFFDKDIVLKLTGLGIRDIIFMSVHILLTSVVLICLVISITSMIKRSEDTGPFVLLVMIPFLLSNMYFVIKADVFSGALSFFNFVPVCSLLPAMGASIVKSISGTNMIIMLVSDVIWIIGAFVFGKMCFEKNISE